MSVSTSPHLDSDMLVVPIAKVKKQQRRMSPVQNLDVLQEMLATLPTLTAEGQRQMMGRIVGIIREHVSYARTLGPRNHAALMTVLDHLGHESLHHWPAVDSFRTAAANVVRLLKAAM
jgi:hypothetical protein